MSYDDGIVDQDYLDVYMQTKEDLENTKIIEAKMRKAICEHFFPNVIKGTKKTYAGGFNIKAQFSLNTSVDKHLMFSAWDELPENIKSCFSIQYNFLPSKLKDLDDEDVEHVKLFITEKPSMPTLIVTLQEPDEEIV